MAQPLPRFYAHTTRHQDEMRITRIVNEGGLAEAPPTTTSTATLAGDRRRLRGIPVVGGVGGTSPGTDPLGALLHKEALQTRRRK